MLGKKIDNIYFSILAKKAKKAEARGNFKEEGRLLCILEENNRCLCCGAEQFFDEAYYKRTGIWKCPNCNKHS